MRKSTKIKKDAFVMEEVVEPIHGGRRYEPLRKGTAEISCQHKSDERANSQADGGEEGAQIGAVEIAPQNSGRLAGDGRGHHLESLQHHENHGRPGTEGFQEQRELLLAEKKSYEIEMIRQKGNAADNDQQQTQLDIDVIPVVSVNFPAPLSSTLLRRSS